jgi:hypothetical protein
MLFRHALKFASIGAILCLSVAWIASIYMLYRGRFPVLPRGHAGIGFDRGAIYVGYSCLDSRTHFEAIEQPVGRDTSVFGRFGAKIAYSDRARLGLKPGDVLSWYVGFPIPFAITCLLPLAIGAFSGFRFRVWMWFAWTAILAAEFAFLLDG